MTADKKASERIPCYCALCVSRCGATAVVEDGRFIALEPDPSHPTGKALCAKGRAGPELVYNSDRLLYPLKRTRPKGDPDPGWQRISWDEALDTTAAEMRRLADAYGPESVAFSEVSFSTSAMDDSWEWLDRLMATFGTPNLCASFELCGYGRYLATYYTFGASVPGHYMPDLDNAGCILFWGYNPNLARLTHATATAAALRRGARLIVVDPRRIGLAKKADVWLQVRPGTDGALALGLANILIERGWFDRDFVRDWTNGPLLVRSDTGRLLTEADLITGGSDKRYVAWNETGNQPIVYDPALRSFLGTGASPALFGSFSIATVQGNVDCRTAFDLTAATCRQYPPERVEAICGIAADQIERAAELLWEARPVAYYAWSGVEMQSNATQIARAIAQLYALTGNLDSLGGNVLFPSVPTADVGKGGLPSPKPAAPALSLGERPLGGARLGLITSDELYQAILKGRPYPVRGLVGFGANLLLAHADPVRGRKALAALDFFVHADLFMNPTAELADIVLPVASAFERQALKVGFVVSPEAQSVVQLRRPVAKPRGEARGDTEIIFDLAVRLGLGQYFWDGDIESGLRFQLEPSGISLETLRENPGGIRAPLETRYRKFAAEEHGVPKGFNTPTGRIELYSETMLAHGYPPLPDYEEPLVGPETQPDLAERYPLILTCAKHTLFCETQHRALPSLRRQAMEPEVELHPAAAEERGIAANDWVFIETPDGRVRARAKFNDTLQPDVVCGQHGWWQAAPEIDAPGYDPFSDAGANYNLLIGNKAIDPVSGSVPHRAYLCQIRPVD